MNIREELKGLDEMQCVKFVLSQAEASLPFITNEKTKKLNEKCISSVKRWLDSPTEENRKICHSDVTAYAYDFAVTNYNDAATQAQESIVNSLNGDKDE